MFSVLSPPIENLPFRNQATTLKKSFKADQMRRQAGWFVQMLVPLQKPLDFALFRLLRLFIFFITLTIKVNNVVVVWVVCRERQATSLEGSSSHHQFLSTGKFRKGQGPRGVYENTFWGMTTSPSSMDHRQSKSMWPQDNRFSRTLWQR